MEYKLDFRELEKKYDYKIKYPGVYRVDIKTRLMEKFVCVYTIMRKKFVRLFHYLLKKRCITALEESDL